MREILFRGKSIDNGKWIYGGYFHLHKTTYCFAGDDDGNNDIHRIVFERMTDWNLPNQHMMADVLPETVGQYTGLTDKNGVRIFEGDIVTGYFNHEKIVGYIFYGGNAQFFIQRDGIYGIGLDNSDCWLEVIGNIHDDPELLKGGDGNG